MLIGEINERRRADDEWHRIQDRMREKIRRLRAIELCSLFLYHDSTTCDCYPEPTEEEVAA
jgi:hypothetical protein